jgi:hypothetical protein
MRVCYGVLVLLLLTEVLWAQTSQYPLPFNVDVIRETGGTVNDGLGLSREAYVTQAEAAANDPVDPRGLPDNGILGSLQLGPYNGNNALRLREFEGGPQMGIPFSQNIGVTVYAAAADFLILPGGPPQPPNPNLQVFVTYFQHGSAQLYSFPISSFRSSGGLIGEMDTTGALGQGFIDQDRVGIGAYHFSMSNSGALPPLSSFRLVNGTSISHANVYIFAVTVTVPEPSAAMALLCGVLLLSARNRRC